MIFQDLALDEKRLHVLADLKHKEFVNAEPFPHVVIDNFLPVELANLVESKFPKMESMEKYTFQDYENKIALRPEGTECPVEVELALNSLNSGKFITFLEKLTGINGLLGDSHFEGGGLHQVGSGGKLGVSRRF